MSADQPPGPPTEPTGPTGQTGPGASGANAGDTRLARLQAKYDKLAQSKRIGPLKAVADRFAEIKGVDLGLLISLELFTTMIPLMILGYAYAKGASASASPGAIIVANFGIEDPLTDVVEEAFASSSEVRSVFSIGAVIGFLLWGIPMSITIASMYARAWRREQFGYGQRLARGAVWFVAYLLMLGLREEISFAGNPHGLQAYAQYAVALVIVWAFWSVTPLLLVRDGGRGPRFLVMAGLAGLVIEGIIIPVASRMIFPSFLQSLSAFGPIGVALALLTWCSVLGVGWVVTACTSAVWWERAAPAQTVIEAQDAAPMGSERL